MPCLPLLCCYYNSACVLEQALLHLIVNQRLYVIQHAKLVHSIATWFPCVRACFSLCVRISKGSPVCVQFAAQFIRDCVFKQFVDARLISCVVKRFTRFNKFSYCAWDVCLCVHVCII